MHVCDAVVIEGERPDAVRSTKGRVGEQSVPGNRKGNLRILVSAIHSCKKSW